VNKRLWVMCCLIPACGTTSGVIDRSGLVISDNSRIVARNVIPGSLRHPTIVEHLGLAQEVYQTQLGHLKTRRNSLRSRTRFLDATSYGVFTMTTLGVGITAIATEEHRASRNLQTAGYAALGGLAAGTLLKVLGFMQEEPSGVDVKIRHLQSSYDAMLARIRLVGEGPVEADIADDRRVTEMAAAIEKFITEAMQIDVRG